MLSESYFKDVAAQLIGSAGIDATQLSGQGLVIWLTGLSGAGKTTIATRLTERNRSNGRPCVMFDGDLLRALFAQHVGHGRDQRLQLALTYGRLCQAVAAKGVDVICATISMFHQVHDWNRANLPCYLEVYLKVPIDELKRRDPKGLYQRAEAGELQDMVGIHVPAEEPLQPHLTIDNCGDISPDAAAETIWARIEEARAAGA